MQRLVNLSTLIVFIGLIFIGIGDGFLPEPLSNFSSQTRGKINQSLMDLFPDRKAIDLYEKTDRLIEEVEEVEE